VDLQAFYDTAVVEEVSSRLIKPTTISLRVEPLSLDELSVSIRSHGLLQPIIVRPRDGHFEVVAGNRRLAACKRLKWPKIPCIVRDLTDREAFELALTENVQRKSMNPLEEALAFQHYISRRGWGSEEELARKLGKSSSYVSQRIGLLRLPPDIRRQVASGSLLPSLAREIVSIGDQDEIHRLASLAISRRSSSRELHEYVRSCEPPPWPSGVTEDRTDRDSKILKKSILILRVAMLRIDSLVEKVEDLTTRQYLTSMRRELHDMIDGTIRQSIKRKEELSACDFQRN
jgi:ParB family transcriptional regulator, chromosome partitioning protein